MSCHLRQATETMVRVWLSLVYMNTDVDPMRYSLPAQHACTLPCHAPASCNESEPCRSIVTITCPCGRIRQPVPCGRSLSNPAGREGGQQLKCSNECAIAKRNARLAEALGINPDRERAHQVTYSDELVGFARANAKFCTIVEKSFSEYVHSCVSCLTMLIYAVYLVSSLRTRRSRSCLTCPSKSASSCTILPPCIAWTRRWSTRNPTAASSSSAASTPASRTPPSPQPSARPPRARLAWGSSQICERRGRGCNPSLVLDHLARLQPQLRNHSLARPRGRDGRRSWLVSPSPLLQRLVHGVPHRNARRHL